MTTRSLRPDLAEFDDIPAPQPAIRLECLADVLALANGACQHGGANPADRDEIAAARLALLSKGI